MPFNLLLFPLVGGYYLLVTLEKYKYKHQRLDSQRLLFNSVIAGAFLLLVSFILCSLISYCFTTPANWLKTYFPIRIDYFGTACTSFILSLVIPQLLNQFYNSTDFISQSIDEIGTELEALVKLSFEKAQLVQVTLKNGKVYIGWAAVLSIPNKSSFIRIIPALSGFRNENRKLIITTQYLQVYADYINEGKIKSIDDLEMNLIIKIEEVITATKFDIVMYKKFNDVDKPIPTNETAMR